MWRVAPTTLSGSILLRFRSTFISRYYSQQKSRASTSSNTLESTFSKILQTVEDKYDNVRTDRFLKIHFPTITHSLVQKLVRQKKIYLTSESDPEARIKIDCATRLKAGQILHVPNAFIQEKTKKSASALPQNIREEDAKMIKKCVVYKDKDIFILNKPPGLPVQGGTKSQVRNIVRFLPALREQPDDDVPRLLHRLDKDTSGVLMLARTRQAAVKFSQYFKSKRETLPHIEKCYLAILMGVPEPRLGRIRSALKKTFDQKSGSEKMKTTDKREGKGSKVGVTEYEVLEDATEVSYVSLLPVTGRTHQLRVHCKEILKCPIVGDTKYGEGIPDTVRHLVSGGKAKLHLHAAAVRFPHPTKPGQKLTVTAPLPEHFANTCAQFGFPLKPRIPWVEPETYSEVHRESKHDSHKESLQEKLSGERRRQRKSREERYKDLAERGRAKQLLREKTRQKKRKAKAAAKDTPTRKMRG